MSDHPRATSPQGDSPPTTKQQRYLRQLAIERGISFTPPRTRREASRLIDDLKRRSPDSRAERARDRRAIADAMAAGTGSTSIREDEITGYGSNCQWSHLVHDE
jgi:hypothetical protein